MITYKEQCCDSILVRLKGERRSRRHFGVGGAEVKAI